MVRTLISSFYNQKTDKAAMILTADPVQSHRYGVDLVRRHGKVVIVAQPPKFDFNWNDFIFRDLTFIGHLHGNGSDLQEVVDIVADKGISVSVTEFGIEDHEKMVDSLGDESRKGKSVLVF
jgi:D-arabinose 1-dehydrogenase-like Zn-dependent alcohol dehydrogenase